jgi:hypothetical protein
MAHLSWFSALILLQDDCISPGIWRTQRFLRKPFGRGFIAQGPEQVGPERPVQVPGRDAEPIAGSLR